MNRKKIARDTKIEIRLSKYEYELISEHTFVDTKLIECIRVVPGKSGFMASYTLDDLDDVLGFIAAEANHATNKILEAELDDLYDRLSEVEDSYQSIDD